MNKSEMIDHVERAIAHDQDAIAALYHDTYAAAYAFTFYLCHNHHDVEDILQESYLSAFESLHNIQNKTKFWQFLRGIILHKWQDYCKALAGCYDIAVYESAVKDDWEDWQFEASVQSVVENHELSRVIRQTIEQLPEKQRVCALLYYYDNLSMAQIAQKLQIPVGSVKSRLHYARRKIRHVLREQQFFGAAAAASSAATDSAACRRILSHVMGELKGWLQSPASPTGRYGGLGWVFRLAAGILSSMVAATGAVIVLPHFYVPQQTPETSVTIPAMTTSTTATAITTASSTTASTTTATTATEVSTTTTQPPRFVSFEYQMWGDGACITRYTGNEGEVSVPSELDGYPVVAIGDRAFMNCDVLRRVALPGSVTSIGGDAFRECDNLCAVSFGSGVSEIGDMAFVGCDSLQSVDLPGSVRHVGIYAFSYCASLRRVNVSYGTRTIRYNAFFACPALSSVTLPASVTVIGADAFAGASAELVLWVPEDSYAQEYAAECGLSYGLY